MTDTAYAPDPGAVMTPERFGGTMSNGIAILPVGEDGEFMVALGHHDPAAFLAAGERIGWCIDDDITASDVVQAMAVEVDPVDGRWCISWEDDDVASHSGAFPVTYLAYDV